MSDEYAIRQLVEKYADAVNRVDKEDWASTWCEDSEWDLSSCLLYTSPSPRDRG